MVRVVGMDIIASATGNARLMQTTTKHNSIKHGSKYREREES